MRERGTVDSTERGREKREGKDKSEMLPRRRRGEKNESLKLKSHVGLCFFKVQDGHASGSKSLLQRGMSQVNRATMFSSF